MLTPDELQELKHLHFQMAHEMSESDLHRRGELWAKATDDEMAQVIGPQATNSSVYGSLVKIKDGYAVASHSAHYADDANWTAVESLDDGGYRVPQDLQELAAKLYGDRKTSPLVVATVRNNKLGAPSGPVVNIKLDPIQEKWDQEADETLAP